MTGLRSERKTNDKSGLHDIVVCGGDLAAKQTLSRRDGRVSRLNGDELPLRRIDGDDKGTHNIAALIGAVRGTQRRQRVAAHPGSKDVLPRSRQQQLQEALHQQEDPRDLARRRAELELDEALGRQRENPRGHRDAGERLEDQRPWHLRPELGLRDDDDVRRGDVVDEHLVDGGEVRSYDANRSGVEPRQLSHLAERDDLLRRCDLDVDSHVGILPQRPGR